MYDIFLDCEASIEVEVETHERSPFKYNLSVKKMDTSPFRGEVVGSLKYIANY